MMTATTMRTMSGGAALARAAPPLLLTAPRARQGAASAATRVVVASSRGDSDASVSGSIRNPRARRQPPPQQQTGGAAADADAAAVAAALASMSRDELLQLVTQQRRQIMQLQQKVQEQQQGLEQQQKELEQRAGTIRYFLDQLEENEDGTVEPLRRLRQPLPSNIRRGAGGPYVDVFVQEVAPPVSTLSTAAGGGAVVRPPPLTAWVTLRQFAVWYAATPLRRRRDAAREARARDRRPQGDDGVAQRRRAEREPARAAPLVGLHGIDRLHRESRRDDGARGQPRPRARARRAGGGGDVCRGGGRHGRGVARGGPFRAKVEAGDRVERDEGGLEGAARAAGRGEEPAARRGRRGRPLKNRAAIIGLPQPHTLSTTHIHCCCMCNVTCTFFLLRGRMEARVGFASKQRARRAPRAHEVAARS